MSTRLAAAGAWHPLTFQDLSSSASTEFGVQQVCCCLCSLVPAVIAHPAGGGNVTRFTLATTTVGGYQLSSGNAGWLHYAPPYLMQTPITAVCTLYCSCTAFPASFTVLTLLVGRHQFSSLQKWRSPMLISRQSRTCYSE